MLGLDVAQGSSPPGGASPSLTPYPSAALSSGSPSRPESPDGLGNGIFSSVFVDAGVEGLIYGAGVALQDNKYDLETPSQSRTGKKFEHTVDERAFQETEGWLSTPTTSSQPLSSEASGGSLTGPLASPKRRETTFGATLDFVEALCMASSNLTAFPPDEREWALHKALQSINNEMDRAAAAGVAVWWPLGRSLHQRVLRLAYRESHLLNSREKAPFTLFVEVIDETLAKASQREAVVAAQSLNSRMPHSPVILPPPRQEMDLDPAAAEAWAEGIPWIAHHHRKSSQDVGSLMSSLSGAGLLPTQGTRNQHLVPDSPMPTRAEPLVVPSTVSFHGPVAAGIGSDPSIQSQRSDISTLATEVSFADFGSELSHSPPGYSTTSCNDDLGDEPQCINHFLTSSVGVGMTNTGQVSQSRSIQVQGGGTWIGASGIKAATQGTQVMQGPSLSLADLRSEAAHVSVCFHVIDEGTALNENIASTSEEKEGEQSSVSLGSSCDGSVESEDIGYDGDVRRSTLRRSVTVPLTSRSVVHPQPHRANEGKALEQQSCPRSGWLCKLGLCKLCSSSSQKKKEGCDASEAGKISPSVALEGSGKKAEDSPEEPWIKVSFVVRYEMDLSLKRNKCHQRMPSHEALLQVAKQHKLPPPPSKALEVTRSPSSAMTMANPLSPQSREHASSIYGENWKDQKARLQKLSACGKRPGWDVRSVIVKSGDDCRQELLAMQLITAFHEIFQEARLRLYLRPYEVLVTSNRTALIEMVPNAPSIHAIKSKYPPGVSLREHFVAKHGPPGSTSMVKAQRNFVESLAAYSLVCYFLQVRDRHNGNILLDDAGHVIHIDFGFMLSNSPGGVNFESAPFKLTRELLEVMDSDPEGTPSEAFDYFKVLIIQGFLAVRRHAERIILLVEMMADSGCPCFKNRNAAVQGVKRRMALGLAEPVLVDTVLGLISDSLDAWSTRQYDMYQKVLNGIL